MHGDSGSSQTPSMVPRVLILSPYPDRTMGLGLARSRATLGGAMAAGGADKAQQAAEGPPGADPMTLAAEAAMVALTGLARQRELLEAAQI
jgi:hypothetical protein